MKPTLKHQHLVQESSKTVVAVLKKKTQIQETDQYVAGAQKKVQVSPLLSTQALRDLAAAIVQIGLAKGYPTANANNAIFALQYDLLQAMAGAVPANIKALQWYWDIRAGVMPTSITVEGLGTASFGFNTGGAAPINVGVAGFCYAYAPNVSSFTAGLPQLTILSTPTASGVPAALADFFNYLATEKQPLVDWNPRAIFSNDVSAFAYKINTLPNGAGYTASGSPLSGVVNNEYPIKTWMGHLGLALNTDGQRVGRFSKNSNIGTGAAIMISFLLREKGCVGDLNLADQQLWFDGKYKWVSLELLLYQIFSSFEYAYQNWLDANRNETNFPLNDLDAVAMCITVLGVWYNLMGVETAGSIGVNFGNYATYTGTNVLTASAYSTYSLPGFVVEQLKSYLMSYSGKFNYGVPLVWCDPGMIGRLAAAFPSYNWTNFGGASLDLSTSTISGQAVSLIPNISSALNNSISINDQLVNEMNNILQPQQVNGYHQWTLMNYMELMVVSTGTEEVRDNFYKKLARFRKRDWKKMKLNFEKANEMNVNVAVTAPNTWVSSVIQSERGFFSNWKLDQHFNLPVAPPGLLNPTQVYFFWYGTTYLNAPASQISTVEEGITSVTQFVNDAVAYGKTENAEDLSDRLKQHMGGNFIEGITKGVTNLVAQLGPTFRSITPYVMAGMNVLKMFI